MSKKKVKFIVAGKDDNLYFINSYKRNEKQAIRLKDNLVKMGVNRTNIKIIYGYDLTKPEIWKKKHPKLTKQKLVFHNFFDFILPEMLKSGKNAYYLEDHTVVYDNPDKYPKDNKLVWLGFMKRLKDYIVGAHLVYLDKDLIKELDRDKAKYRPAYIDRFFKNLAEKKGYLQIDKSITKIIEHFSLALGKVRKNPKNKYFFKPDLV